MSPASRTPRSRRALRRHPLPPFPGFTGSAGAGGGGVARHVAEPGMPEQVVPVGMGGEPGDHRNTEPVQVIGELLQIGPIDARIDQDQPVLPAHRDGIAHDPRALPDPDTVGHLIQHRLTLVSYLRPGTSGLTARSMRTEITAQSAGRHEAIDSVWDRKRAVTCGCAGRTAGWAVISRGITFGGLRIWKQTGRGQGLARIAVAC